VVGAVAVDKVIAAIAARQSGYILREQLVALDLTRSAIACRIKRGLLIPVHRGVYAVAHIPRDPKLRAHAALLACGKRSALAGGSAMSLYRLIRYWREPFEVIVAGSDLRPSAIKVRTSRRLLTRDIRALDGLRVTSPALTVLHNAQSLSDKRLTRAVNELRMEHRLTHEQLVDVVERFPRAPGARRVRSLFGVTAQEPDRSQFEQDWRPFARTHKLQGWDTNQIVCGYRVDVLFAPDLLIVELDGWGTHGTKPAFTSDREQDADILDRVRIPTYRISRDSFKAHPKRHADRIHRILAGRRGDAAS
jgi:very-short-patch-repair endonuclease